MKIKTLKIISSIAIFALCFLTHFGYQVMPNVLSSVLFPVNESIYEHLKMIYSTVIIWSVIEIIIIKTKKLDVNNLYLNAFMSGVINVIIYLALYLPIRSIIGEAMIITFIILFISICLTQLISYYIYMSDNVLNNSVSVAFIILTFIGLSYYTYDPMKNDLFYDSDAETYGIKKG